jgi:hypothetical protein
MIILNTESSRTHSVFTIRLVQAPLYSHTYTLQWTWLGVRELIAQRILDRGFGKQGI